MTSNIDPADSEKPLPPDELQYRVSGVREEHRLWSCEVDPDSGLVRDPDAAVPHPLGGAVRRIVGR